jgi:hypothetical protein
MVAGKNVIQWHKTEPLIFGYKPFMVTDVLGGIEEVLMG